MTKTEKKSLASKCGYEYNYSGKTGKGEFKKIEGTDNLIVSDEDLSKLKTVIAQKNK